VPYGVIATRLVKLVYLRQFLVWVWHSSLTVYARDHLRRGFLATARKTAFGLYRDPPLPRTLSHHLWVASGYQWNLGPHIWQRTGLAVQAITWRTESECIVIASDAIGGGQGKSSTGLSIAQCFALQLHGKTLLLDMDPSGVIEKNSGVQRNSIQVERDRLKGEACFTVWEAFVNRGKLGCLNDMLIRFAQMPGTDLYVVTAGDRPLTNVQYEILLPILKKLFAVIVVDCAPDIETSSATQAVVQSADAVAIAVKHRSETRVGQVSKLIRMIDSDPRYSKQRNRIVLVVNEVWFNPLHIGTTRTLRLLQADRAAQGLEPYRGSVATQPFNLHIRRKGGFKLVARSSWFRLHSLEIAAALKLLARKGDSQTARPNIEVAADGATDGAQQDLTVKPRLAA
jgi:cellulose biosynthesis protein BcsQ